MIRNSFFATLFIFGIAACLPYKTAQAGDYVNLKINIINNSSHTVLVEDGRNFESDNPNVNTKVIYNKILSREIKDSIIITWESQGESSFSYLFNIKSDNNRYYCSISLKTLYYDDEPNGIFIVKPTITTPHPVDDEHPDCADYKFSANFMRKSDGNGIVNVTVQDF